MNDAVCANARELSTLSVFSGYYEIDFVFRCCSFVNYQKCVEIRKVQTKTSHCIDVYHSEREVRSLYRIKYN